MRFCASVFFALAATAASIFTVSCSKNISVIEVEVEEPLSAETFIDGKILSKTASLCLFGRDSAMHSVIKLSAGADIAVLEVDGVIATMLVPDETSPAPEASADGENPDGTFAGTEYVRVVHNNMDFWLEKSVLALNCENAVAIERVFLYSDPDLSQKLGSPQNPLKFAARIAKSKDESLSENSESVRIFYYDSAAKSVREAFVAASSISARKDDIVVSQIAETLKTTTRAVPRNELFAEAAKYRPCQKVLAVLNAQKEEKKSYNYQEVLKSMQRMSFGVNVDELLTVDQSKDPFK